MRKNRFLRRSLSFLLAALMSLSLCLCPVSAAERERSLIPLGTAVGIKLFADGALVVAVSPLDDEQSPAQDCGLKEGDLILRLNSERIDSTEQMQSLLQENGALPVHLTVRRGAKLLALDTEAVQCDDGVYRLGAWIRDSMAGIGTLTYYDPATGRYGALGHGITDVDTAQLMPLSKGSIMETTVKSVRKGVRGTPGELKGDFSVQRDVGTLTANTDGGIFGTVSDSSLVSGTPIPIGDAKQVHCGKAIILSTVDGEGPKEYTVEILRVYNCAQPTRNLLLQVTDERLLSVTGGIIPGMSGSPILQDGRLVGAVTHVLVDDPSRGYGIFIENMLDMAG